MHNSVQKKQERHIAVEQVTVENTDNRETLENIVEFVARDRLIAQQSEDACNLPGNNSSADMDAFAEKYGFGCFA